MKKPIPEMTKEPFGEDYMFPAWMGLVCHAVNQKVYTDQFKQATGIDILNIVRSKGINAMIDAATGYQKTALIKWCDWVTENIWGEEIELEPLKPNEE